MNILLVSPSFPWPPFDGGRIRIFEMLRFLSQRHQVTLICRLRLDAGLYDPPGPQPPGKRGPKPKKGPRQRRLTEWATVGV